jgi:hypothetical protein
MSRIQSVLLLLASLSSMTTQAGIISGGGAGLPQLPSDMHFEFSCTMSIQSYQYDKNDQLLGMAAFTSRPFNYSDESGNKTGVLEIVTTADNWVEKDNNPTQVNLVGHKFSITPGMATLTLAVDENTKLTNEIYTSSNQVLSGDRNVITVKNEKTVDGIRQTLSLFVGCRQNKSAK